MTVVPKAEYIPPPVPLPSESASDVFAAMVLFWMVVGARVGSRPDAAAVAVGAISGDGTVADGHRAAAVVVQPSATAVAASGVAGNGAVVDRQSSVAVDGPGEYSPPVGRGRVAGNRAVGNGCRAVAIEPNAAAILGRLVPRNGAVLDGCRAGADEIPGDNSAPVDAGGVVGDGAVLDRRRPIGGGSRVDAAAVVGGRIAGNGAILNRRRAAVGKGEDASRRRRPRCSPRSCCLGLSNCRRS